MDIKELLEGLDLDKSIFTEAVIEKMAVVVESLLGTAKGTLEEEIETKYATDLKEYKEFLTTQLDNYLNEYVEKFTEANKVQIHESVKVRTAEKVLANFKNMVEQFNITLSEDSVSDSLETDELKESLNKAVNENIELKTKIEDEKVASLISEVSEGIEIDSIKASFKELSESLKFDGEVSFKDRLVTLKESLGKNVSSGDKTETLTEGEVDDNQETTTPLTENVTTGTMSDTQKEILSVFGNR